MWRVGSSHAESLLRLIGSATRSVVSENLHQVRTFEAALVCNGSIRCSYNPPPQMASGSRNRFRSPMDKLFAERIIQLVGPVDETMAYSVTTQLLLMEADNPKKPIFMYINSGGGSVPDGLAIYDTMQFVAPPIHTVGVGKCMSMAAVLLAAGEPGKRLVLPHTKVMVHQPLGGVQGSSTNMEAAVESMVDYRNRLKDILIKHCSQTEEEVDKSFVTDTYFSAEKAVEWGLADSIVESRKWQKKEGEDGEEESDAEA